MKRFYKLNASLTFIKRSRCKFCGKPPSGLFLIKQPEYPASQNSVRKVFDYITEHTKRMCSDFYLIESPSSFSNINYFVSSMISTTGFRFNPKLHRTRGNYSIGFIEYFTCECRSSIWAFIDLSSANKPEVICRRAKYCY